MSAKRRKEKKRRTKRARREGKSEGEKRLWGMKREKEEGSA